jgi:Family of unknown function (DUF6220)
MSVQASQQDGSDTAKPSRLAQVSRRAYLIVAWLFLIGVTVQVFLAGLSIFAGSNWWTAHKTSAHIIEYLPILLIPLALLGRMPRSIVLLSGLLILLFVLQYAFIETAAATGLSWLAAFHPVNALVIFAVTLAVAQRARREAGC